MKKLSILLIVAINLIMLSACGSSREIEILDVYFSQDQTEEGLAARKDEFYSSDSVYINISLNGPPTEGVIEVEFNLSDYLTINSIETSFPMEDYTDDYDHLYFTLEPDDPFRVSSNYWAIIWVNGEEFGRYNFKIIPPENAIPTQLKEAMLVYADFNSEDIVETNTFSTDQVVTFYFTADMGEESWFETAWYKGDHATGEFILDCGTAMLNPENLEDAYGIDDCFPANGWESGEYELVLSINGEDVGFYPFTIE